MCACVCVCKYVSVGVYVGVSPRIMFIKSRKKNRSFKSFKKTRAAFFFVHHHLNQIRDVRREMRDRESVQGHEVIRKKQKEEEE
jgi:hypothetical protein